MLRYTKHPGPDYVYVICDVCGRKVRRKDTKLVTDRYNWQNGLVVCKWDLDKRNEQSVPHKIKEKIVTSPETLRSEQTDKFQTNTDRAPSAPRKLVAKASTLGSDIELFWQAPLDTGSTLITGYKIERAEPQYGGYDVISSNTQSNGTYYLDTTADIASEYTYRVSAINGAGTSPVSNIAPFPVQSIIETVVYLGVSQTENVLGANSGDAIVLSPDV